MREWEASEEQESPGNPYIGDCVTLLRKSDGTLYFWRTEHQLRRFDNYLQSAERALIDRVWPSREKFFNFSLVYVPTPEFVTKSEVLGLMEEQSKMFLRGIEILVKQLVVPTRQDLAITPAQDPVVETTEPKTAVEPKPGTSGVLTTREKPKIKTIKPVNLALHRDAVSTPAKKSAAGLKRVTELQDMNIYWSPFLHKKETPSNKRQPSEDGELSDDTSDVEARTNFERLAALREAPREKSNPLGFFNGSDCHSSAPLNDKVRKFGINMNNLDSNNDKTLRHESQINKSSNESHCWFDK